MINDALLFLYLANSVFIINHEIDSAYWQEWKLFHIKGGINTFLIIHFPVLFFILIGILEINKGSNAGYILSMILSIGGISAYIIHAYFLKKGNREFDTFLSKFILKIILILSIIELLLTMYLF